MYQIHFSTRSTWFKFWFLLHISLRKLGMFAIKACYNFFYLTDSYSWNLTLGIKWKKYLKQLRYLYSLKHNSFRIIYKLSNVHNCFVAANSVQAFRDGKCVLGSFWLVLARSGSFCLVARCGSLWFVLARSGLPWLVLARSGTFWLILAHSGTSWLLLARCG